LGFVGLKDWNPERERERLMRSLGKCEREEGKKKKK
jgi:hypothetical protein